MTNTTIWSTCGCPLVRLGITNAMGVPIYSKTMTEILQEETNSPVVCPGCLTEKSINKMEI